MILMIHEVSGCSYRDGHSSGLELEELKSKYPNNDFRMLSKVLSVIGRHMVGKERRVSC